MDFQFLVIMKKSNAHCNEIDKTDCSVVILHT